LNLKYRLYENWSISGGYQWLSTGDKDVIEKIKAGEMYGREEKTGEVYLLKRNDYYGLPGRSRHMGHVKIMFDEQTNGWHASLRDIYRSRWGTFDQDGNGIINRKDETAPGFVLLNAAVQKQISPSLTMGAGVENILNHRDALNLPNVPGINAFVSIAWKIKAAKANLTGKNHSTSNSTNQLFK
jgi:outer membrane receptor for ferrienterochelin and colicins